MRSISSIRNGFAKLSGRGKTIAVLALAAGMFTSGVAMASPSVGLTAETLAEGAFQEATTVATRDAKDIVTQKLVIEPGGETGWHWHPGVVVLTVQKGDITRVTKTRNGCTTELFKQGTSFIKQGRDPLNGYNRGTEPIELWLTYIQPENTPLRYETNDPGC